MKKRRNTKLFEWQTRIREAECDKCGSPVGITVDHIVPVSIIEQFGLDRLEALYEMEENFEYLCRYCNQMKAARLDVRNPKTFIILEKLIAQVKQELKI